MPAQNNQYISSVEADSIATTRSDPSQMSPIAVFDEGVIANAGLDQIDSEPWSVITLDGAASTAVAGVSGYNWKQIAGVPVVLSGSGAIRTFVAPAHITGAVLEFQLMVTDVNGQTAGDSTRIEILRATEYKAVNGSWQPLGLNGL